MGGSRGWGWSERVGVEEGWSEWVGVEGGME